MDRTDRAGHDALTKLFSRFTRSQVDPGWLADQLLTQYIIGEDTQDYAANPYHSRAERLRRVLREVMGNGREGVFQDLAGILLESETYSWLGRELKGRLMIESWLSTCIESEICACRSTVRLMTMSQMSMPHETRPGIDIQCLC